jgi:hypothetical protein
MRHYEHGPQHNSVGITSDFIGPSKVSKCNKNGMLLSYNMKDDEWLALLSLLVFRFTGIMCSNMYNNIESWLTSVIFLKLYCFSLVGSTTYTFYNYSSEHIFDIIGCFRIYHCTFWVQFSWQSLLGLRCKSYYIQEEKEEKLPSNKGTPSGNFVPFYFPVLIFSKWKFKFSPLNLSSVLSSYCLLRQFPGIDKA